MWSVKHSPGGMVAAVVLVAFAHSSFADGKPVKSKNAQTPEQAIEFLMAASKAGDTNAALDQIAEPFHDVMLYYIVGEKADTELQDALDQKFGKEKRRGFSPGVEFHLLGIQKIEILATDKESDKRVKLRVRETFKSFHDDRNEVVETTFLALKDGDRWKLLRPYTAMFLDLHDADMTEKYVSKKGPDGKEMGMYQITFKKDLDVLGQQVRKIVEKRGNATLTELLAREKRHKAVAEKVVAEIQRGAYKTRQEAQDAYDEAVARADKNGK